MVAKKRAIKNPLGRRWIRELKDDKGKYIALFLFLMLTIGFIAGFLVADDSMKKAYDDSFEKYNVEDGHFALEEPISIRLNGKLKDAGITAVPQFFKDEDISKKRTVRLYKIREEDQCTIMVEKAAGYGRYDRIVSMIEESEKLKSSSEDKASHLADKLVPFSLGATMLTYILTRNITKALAILMVDFSCALKLSMPISVLSAMKEAGEYGITVKGGKFLEAVAEADTIVFDKTGTLTHACPKVEKVIPFGGNDENEMLRVAACLEEHYPHSMANAVVEAANVRGLMHEEKHTQVEYVVAHGISSILDGEKVIIGSYHFVFQDEGCLVPNCDAEKFRDIPGEYSHLHYRIQFWVDSSWCSRNTSANHHGAAAQCFHTGDRHLRHHIIASGTKEPVELLSEIISLPRNSRLCYNWLSCFDS